MWIFKFGHFWNSLDNKIDLQIERTLTFSFSLSWQWRWQRGKELRGHTQTTFLSSIQEQIVSLFVRTPSLAWPHFLRKKFHSPPNGDFCPTIWAAIYFCDWTCVHLKMDHLKKWFIISCFPNLIPVAVFGQMDEQLFNQASDVQSIIFLFFIISYWLRSLKTLYIF